MMAELWIIEEKRHIVVVLLLGQRVFDASDLNTWFSYRGGGNGQ